ncbi:hypothetical protein [Mycobacterium intracellulare]|uniref:hypothetical protein n=1 Tax=Mycobacterium intracellulare TaxID=1767 RepID=UPI0034D3D81B
MTRYGRSSDDERELDRLRTELAHHFDTHPTDEWDAPLLRTLIAVFDLAYAATPAQLPIVAGRPVLRLVRDEVTR